MIACSRTEATSKYCRHRRTSEFWSRLPGQGEGEAEAEAEAEGWGEGEGEGWG